MSVEGSDPLQMPEASEVIVEITSEHKGVIEGRFTLPTLSLSKDGATYQYTIRNGRFEAGDSLPEDPPQK